MVNTDLVGFCCIDCNRCGAAFKDIPGNAWEALKFFGRFKWLTNCKVEGAKNFQQYPNFACWHNVPLCCAMCFVPCCCPVVHFHNMEKMSGNSYESECVTCVVLSMCCCMNACYYASRRTALREKYGLRGSECCDCCTFLCSSPCVVCVDANELQHIGGYEIPFCGAKAATVIREVTHADALTKQAAKVNDSIAAKITEKVTPK